LEEKCRGYILKNKINKLFMFAPYVSVALGMYIYKNAYLSLFLYNSLMLLAIILNKNEISFEIILKRKNKGLLLLTSLLSAASGIILFFIWPLIKRDTAEISEMLALYKITPSNILLLVLYFSFIHPTIEELYWRYVLKPQRTILSLSEIAFAAYHAFVLVQFVSIPFTLIAFIGLAIVARIWRYFIDELNENFAVILSHTIADFSIISAVALLSLQH